MEMKVLILGSSGLLGTNLKKKLKNSKSLEVFCHTNTIKSNYMADLSKPNETTKLLNQIKPDFLINLIAITDVNLCQIDNNLAHRTHCVIPENIVKCISDLKLNTKIIHISTDQVYDANNSKESDIILRNVYALTKYYGEEAISGNNTLILRTNFFGGDTNNKSSFTGWINSISNEPSFMGFENIHFNPLHISTLTEILEFLIFNFKPGLFNLGSHSGMTKYSFIKKYLEKISKNTDICRPSMYNNENFPRPKEMIMNLDSFEKTFNISLPILEDEINKEANLYISKNKEIL